MHAEVTVDTAAGGAGAADDLRSLRDWLSTQGAPPAVAVEARESPPAAGTLGPVLDALVVSVGPAGAVTALLTGLLAWLRTRRGDVRITVTLDEQRSFELSATRVADLDATALRRQVADLAAVLDAQDDGSVDREERR